MTLTLTATLRFVLPFAFVIYLAHRLELYETFRVHTLLPLLSPWRYEYPPPPPAVQGQRTQFTSHIVAVGDLHGDMPNAYAPFHVFCGLVLLIPSFKPPRAQIRWCS